MTNKTQPNHPHLSDEQKAKIDALIELQACIGDAHENYGRNDERTMHARQVFKAALSAALATPPAAVEAPEVQINGAPATAHSLLAALLDIYDDAQNNAPENRCYIDSAWSDVLKEARQFLAAQPKADSTEPKGWGRDLSYPYSDGQLQAFAQAHKVPDSPRLLKLMRLCMQIGEDSATPSPVNPASAQAGESLTSVLAEVAHERGRQDAQWGGTEHDDEHCAGDWLIYIDKQVSKSFNAPGNNPKDRERFVKIAALAVAAIESMDRKEAAR